MTVKRLLVSLTKALVVLLEVSSWWSMVGTRPTEIVGHGKVKKQRHPTVNVDIVAEAEARPL